MNNRERIFSDDDFSYIINLIREAGDNARELQKGKLQINRKEDSSIVTQADIETQRRLIAGIEGRFGKMKFIQEEDFDPSSVEDDPDALYAIIDPIDGTAMYSMRLPIWCVSVGIFRGFKPVYGFVYAPAAEMFFHNDDNAAYLNGIPVAAQMLTNIEKETNIFFGAEILGLFRITFPGKVRNLGSTALHCALLADNMRNRSLAFIGKSMIWDWAGAIPILLKAGGRVNYIDGSQIDYRDVIKNSCEFKDFIIAYNSSDFNSVRKYFQLGGK